MGAYLLTWPFLTQDFDRYTCSEFQSGRCSHQERRCSTSHYGDAFGQILFSNICVLGVILGIEFTLKNFGPIICKNFIIVLGKHSSCSLTLISAALKPDPLFKDAIILLWSLIKLTACLNYLFFDLWYSIFSNSLLNVETSLYYLKIPFLEALCNLSIVWIPYLYKIFKASVFSGSGGFS